MNLGGELWLATQTLRSQSWGRVGSVSCLPRGGVLTKRVLLIKSLQGLDADNRHPDLLNLSMLVGNEFFIVLQFQISLNCR